MHQLDAEGLTDIFALSDSESDSASDHVQHLPARLERWLPRWSEPLSSPSRVRRLAIPGNRNPGFKAPGYPLGPKDGRSFNILCGAGSFAGPFTDKAPTGTLCQQMNFLIPLSHGLAMVWRFRPAHLNGVVSERVPLERASRHGKRPGLLYSLEKQMRDEGAPRRIRDRFRKSYSQIILRRELMCRQ